MSLYQYKFKTTGNTTALGPHSFFAVDDGADLLSYIDYIKKNSNWFYHFPSVYWSDTDACERCGLSYSYRLYTNLYDLYVQGNGATLVDIANGGPEYKVTGAFSTSISGNGMTLALYRRSQTPYTSLDYYTDFQINNAIINMGCGCSDQTIDGKVYRNFAVIPVFKHVIQTGGYHGIDPTECFFILCFCVYDSTNQTITDDMTTIATSNSTTSAAPFYTNTKAPISGGSGEQTGPYQIFMSFIESVIKVASGSETHGTEVYNDPNNPKGAAYPAQGYNPDGTPINLFEPGATGGIGGHGSFEEWRDDTGVIDQEGLPSYLGGQDTTPDTTSTGIFSIYQLSSSQLTQLNEKLWSDAFWDSLQNTNLSPLETVIALYKCKIPVESDGTDSIIMGRYNTGMTGTRCKQYKRITLPDIEIKRFYDSWLDQNPHTQLYLYLPYVGLVDINADYYMGRDLRIKYDFDFLSSTCIAKLFTIIDGKEILVETKQGQFGMHIPLTSSRRENIMGSFLQITFGAVAVGLGLATAATGIGAGPGTAIASTGATAIAAAAGGIAAAGVGTQQIANGMQGMNKYQYAIASHIQANSAFMSSNKIYLFRVLPSVQLPEKYNELVGNTAYASMTVQNLKGLSVVKNLKLDNVHATLAEKEELKQIFLSGVYM